MNQRTLIGRLLSPAGFALVLLLFLLPFFTVSCGVADEHIDSTFTGVDFVVGGQPHVTGPDVDAESEKELAAFFEGDYTADPFAIVAVVAIFAGVVVGAVNARLVRTASSAGLAAVSAVLITIAMLRAPGRVDAATNRFRETTQSSDTIEFSHHLQYGYWLTVAVLVGLVVWQGLTAYRAGRTAPIPQMADTGPPGVAAPQSDPGS